MKKQYMLNTLLQPVLGAYLLVCVVVRTFWPRMILPQLDIPMLTALSLVTLLLEHYLAPNARRCYPAIFGWAVATFGLLGFAGLMGVTEAFRLAIRGGIVFTVVTWLFTSMADRMSSGPKAKAAPFVNALGLYLAAQCFMGMF